MTTANVNGNGPTTTTAKGRKKAGSWAQDEGRAEKDARHLEGLQTQPPPKGAPTQGIMLPELDIRTAMLHLVGTSELIVHAWSEKAIRQMLAKQMGLAGIGREKKSPVDDFVGSLYTLARGEVRGDVKSVLDGDVDAFVDGHPDVWLEGGKYGFPAIAFKNAAVTACTSP
jgi:hypothetical protein